MTSGRGGVALRAAVVAERMVSRVSWLFAALALTCVLGLLISSTVDVLGRQVRGRGLPGVVEYGELLLVVVTVLSLAYTFRVGGHVAVDFVVTRLSPRAAAAAQAAGLVAILPVIVWVTLASGQVAAESFASGEYRMGLVRAPLWPARLAVTLGFAALVCEVLVTASRSVCTAFRRT